MIAQTTKALVRLFKTVQPDTYLSAGSIVELAKLPALVLSGPTPQEIKRMRHDSISLVAREGSEYATERAPRWYDLQFGVIFTAKSNIELLAMLEACSRLPQINPLLEANDGERVRGYSWQWTTFPAVYVSPSVSEICEGRGTLVVADVEVYPGLRKIIPAIRSIELEFNPGNERFTVRGDEVGEGQREDSDSV